MKQVRIRPHFKNGQSDGLTLSGIRSDSIFGEMGFRNGDIIVGVDGKDIESVDDALSLYLQQCSAVINCEDLSTMAATLANGGVNPLTNQRAIQEDYVGDLLTVMYTCGMYDFAGEWSYRIGLPAKSGVSGGILAVVPGQMGIAVYSPRLDLHGNSIAGIKVLESISAELDLHIFSCR